MHINILATLLGASRTAASMCCAGLLLFLIALWAARTDIAQARGVDKIVALSNVCFAVPLAVFGAEHFSGARFIMLAVPSYMPWRLFWAYFVGFALAVHVLEHCHKNSGALNFTAECSWISTRNSSHSWFSNLGQPLGAMTRAQTVAPEQGIPHLRYRALIRFITLVTSFGDGQIAATHKNTGN